eukprot:gene10174-11258_t
MSDEEEFEHDSEEEEFEEGEGQIDGFANTMMDILKQETKSKVPVLAGRKTKLMKQMEAEKESSKAVHLKKEAQRRRMKALMGEGGSDDSSVNSFSVDFEKQLRRLATKGVVALFNAVAKAKREKILVDGGKRTEKSTQLARPAPDDDDDHSLGSLRNLQGVHKRPAASSPGPAQKKTRLEPSASSGGWDQDDEDD